MPCKCLCRTSNCGTTDQSRRLRLVSKFDKRLAIRKPISVPVPLCIMTIHFRNVSPAPAIKFLTRQSNIADFTPTVSTIQRCSNDCKKRFQDSGSHIAQHHCISTKSESEILQNPSSDQRLVKSGKARPTTFELTDAIFVFLCFSR